MNRLILPAPLATLLVTRQPCSDHSYLDQCGQMVARWVTQPEDCPYVGERVEFVVSAATHDGCNYNAARFDLVSEAPTLFCNKCGWGRSAVYGSGVIAESLPIVPAIYRTYDDPPYNGHQRIFVSDEQDRLWRTAKASGPPEDITDQLPHQDWSPGRWAWHVEQVEVQR